METGKKLSEKHPRGLEPEEKEKLAAKKPKKEKPIAKPQAKDNPSRVKFIQAMAEFIYGLTGREVGLEVRLAMQYGLLIIGEEASKIKQSFEEKIPKFYRAMPWDNLIKLRQLTSHYFHRLDPDILVKSTKEDMIHIKLIAKNIADKNEAATLDPDDTIFKKLLEHYEDCKKLLKEKKKTKKRKTEEESLARDQRKTIKQLDLILEKLNQLDNFLQKDKELAEPVMQNAAKMALAVIGLSVTEHLPKEFRNSYPLAVEIEGKGKKSKKILMNWKKLADLKIQMIHYYYKYKAEDLRMTIHSALKVRDAINEILERYKKEAEKVSEKDPESEESSIPFSYSTAELTGIDLSRTFSPSHLPTPSSPEREEHEKEEEEEKSKKHKTEHTHTKHLK